MYSTRLATMRIEPVISIKLIHETLQMCPLGFYTAIFLLIMSLTGLFWSFEWYKDAGSRVLGTEVFGGRGGGPKIIS
ncbi:PepSY domain-containing protein [Aequorivita sp. CIP111184]|uniref:PepSY domain-containing protein n=1 Tax=Aequorivita sp. CIP111184 TaxID=2211356 RepID=UPI000DBBFC66|nr:hypothetical protein AEQU1_01277 [Aequorivita sp. CIP111184]